MLTVREKVNVDGAIAKAKGPAIQLLFVRPTRSAQNKNGNTAQYDELNSQYGPIDSEQKADTQD